MSKDEKKTTDILDDVKKAEKVVKAQLLVKKIGELKKLAKDVLLAKEKSKIILEEIGIKDKDIKRIIDFVNESEDVKLTKADKENLKDDIQDDCVEERKKIMRKIEESPNWLPALKGFTNQAYASDTVMSSSLPTNEFNSMTFTGSNKSLEVPI